MDDIKLFAKNERELETLIHAVRIYSQDIGIKFGIEKCAMLVMKSGKRHMSDGMELPNHDRIRTLEENETYKYLGILEADIIKQVQMKDMIRKECCPVSWGCRIHRLLLCRGVRLPLTSVLIMTVNNLMVRFQQCWSFGECGVPLHCHRSQVHSGSEW